MPILLRQIASTAEFERANALATVNSANATQSYALAQDAIRQTQAADQQMFNEFSAVTQTAVANNIATQTQAALATSQSINDQRREPITFLWIWCLPVFIVLLAVLVVWGFWRWLKIRQANQRILENPVDKLQAPRGEIIDVQQDERPYLLTKPSDQARRWLDEVKRKLRNSDEKDEDDDTDN